MLDDAWPEHLEGLQIPGNFHKSRDVVPYSAWNVHEVVAYELQPSTQFKTKPLQHFRTLKFSTCCKHIYKQSFDIYQKIGQNSNEHSKLLRCPSEKRQTDQQPGVLLENQMFPQLLQHYHHDSALSDNSVAYGFK